MKFVLFVEGHTEKKALPEFFKRWLDPDTLRGAFALLGPSLIASVP